MVIGVEDEEEEEEEMSGSWSGSGFGGWGLGDGGQEEGSVVSKRESASRGLCFGQSIAFRCAYTPVDAFVDVDGVS